MKEMAPYQIASELSAGSCTSMTLHSDGTTKHGCSIPSNSPSFPFHLDHSPGSKTFKPSPSFVSLS